jgi:hypothetical protein
MEPDLEQLFERYARKGDVGTLARTLSLTPPWILV